MHVIRGENSCTQSKNLIDKLLTSNSNGIRSDGTQSYTVDAQSYTENGVFFSIFSANLCVTERLPQMKGNLFANENFVR
jgi:hypothetical protein